MGLLTGKKVAFILAPSEFNDEAYFKSRVMLQAQGAQVATVILGDTAEAVGTNGGKARSDEMLLNLTPKIYDGVVIIGGVGILPYFEDEQFKQIITEFLTTDHVVGAIGEAVELVTHQASGLGQNPFKIVLSNNPEEAMAFGGEVANLLNP